MPDIPADAGLLRVEVTGVCGSDAHQQTRMRGTAHILGHEIVGRIAKLGCQAAHKWPFKGGDQVALEEYMPRQRTAVPKVRKPHRHEPNDGEVILQRVSGVP